MRLQFAIALTATALVAGCTQFPDLDAAISPGAEAAPYPQLVPTESLSASVPEPLIEPETSTSLEARVAHLRARAARLRGSVIDSPTRARMTTGVRDIPDQG